MFAAPAIDLKPAYMPKKEKQIGVRVSEELMAKLQELASREKRTVSDYVRIKLEEIVEADKAKG